MRSVSRFALFAVMAAVVVAACGSSGGTTATSGATPGTLGTAPTATDTPGDSGDSGDGGDGGGSDGGGAVSGLPDVIGGTWGTATAHLDVSGDATLSYDGTGSFISINGVALGTFVDSASTATLQITLSKTDESGFVLLSGGFAIGGTWGRECQVSLSRNDGGGLAGEFTCANVQGFDNGGFKEVHVNLRGTFEAST